MTAETREELERRAAGGDETAALALADHLDTEGAYMDALGVLSQAAAKGGAVAEGRIGMRLLLGDRAPHRPDDGLLLLHSAAGRGNADAAMLNATLAGAGYLRPHSWSDALTYLTHAATLGATAAREQLAILSSDRDAARAAREAGEAATPELWARLRDGVDTATLCAPPAGRTLVEEPLIRAFEGFADEETRRWLIEKARGRLRPAEVYNAGLHRVEVHETRTNTAATFNILEADLVGLFLQARIAAATGVPYTHLEALSVLHYGVGEQITEHFDFVDPNMPDYEQQIARDGQRMVTFLVYLNDDYEGGETEFPRLGVSHRGVAGEGMFFTNALASGEADVRSVHAGRPPRVGEKWVATQFIRNRPTRPNA
jgi:prolyl 4-hydroxylase